MYMIVCVDERGGMAFNRRRVSRDRLLCADIARMVGEGVLYLSPYSAPLFAEFPALSVAATEDYAQRAGDADYCFFEREAPGAYSAAAHRLILYRWNRRYPFDLQLDVDPTVAPWRMVSREEFVGSSHEIITKEIYEQ